jgi:hypothetical protein
MAAAEKAVCGHEADGNGFHYVCELEPGHDDPGEVGHGVWHQQTTKLHEGVSITNWGSDGLSIWASKDRERANKRRNRPRTPA